MIFRDMTTGRTRGAITEPNNVILIAGAQSLRGEQYFITGGKDRTIKLTIYLFRRRAISLPVMRNGLGPSTFRQTAICW